MVPGGFETTGGHPRIFFFKKVSVLEMSFLKCCKCFELVTNELGLRCSEGAVEKGTDDYCPGDNMGTFKFGQKTG